jgi:hypothetical protein
MYLAGGEIRDPGQLGSVIISLPIRVSLVFEPHLRRVEPYKLGAIRYYT